MAVLLTPQEFTRIRRAILFRGAVVAAPVAAFASAYFALWQPTYGNYPWIGQLLLNVGESFAYLIMILFVGNALLR